MTTGKRRVHAPALLLFALAALLVFAATASAQTRAGESAAVLPEQTPTPGATIVKATASYETSGNVAFNVTTAGAPSPEGEGEMWAALVTSSNCATPSGKTFFNEILVESPPPFLVVESKLAIAGAQGITGSFGGVKPVTATKSGSGTTTILTATSSEIADGEFNCALVGATDKVEFRIEGEEGVGSSFVGIPLTVQAEPPPPPPPAGSSSQAPPAPAAAAPVPPVLSIAKPKPLTLKAGKWQKVKVKVTNSGPGASAAGSLRLKAPKGVLAKPERQQLPILALGKSFRLTLRVKLTKKAKKKSKVALTAAASGAVSATSSLVVKLKHQ